jgi:membrane protease YdiL (CAAX protease family)
MVKIMRRFPAATYFIMACGLTWAIWIPLALESQGINAPVIPYQHFLGALGPILAAVVTTAIISGATGLRRFAIRITQWRLDLRWYLIAVLGPFLLYLVSLVGLGIFRGEWADPGAFGRSDEFPSLGLVGVFLVHCFTFGVGEEAGWRGFLLPRLQAKYKALAATFILSVFWAVWHIPAFFYRPGYSSMGPADIAGWFLSLATGAILLTWLCNSTRGSILIVALFHGSVDVAFTSKLVDASIMNTMGALLVVWAIAVVLITGPANLSFTERQRIPTVEPPRDPDTVRDHAI